jgi:hypothetical protein
MKRREFLLALGGTAASLPFAALAQTAMPVVGYIGSGLPDDQVNLVNATRQGLKEAGYTEGQNVSIEFRWAEGRYDRLPALAAELVQRQVAVIIAAGGSDPGRAAKAATSSIPIVFITAADPVRTGLVTSLNRPEANVTGISMIGSALEAKRLELLHELVPQASIIGALVNPNYPAAKLQAQEVEEAAARLGLQLVLLNASTEAERHGACGLRSTKNSRVAAGQRPVLRLAAREARGFGDPAQIAGDIVSPGVRGGGRSRELRPAVRRWLSRSRCLCRQDPEGNQDDRSAGDAADQIRTRRQSQDRKGDRAGGLRILPAARRRNHGVGVFVVPANARTHTPRLIDWPIW